MEQRRREFIRIGGLGLLGLFARNQVESSPIPRVEKFSKREKIDWSEIRSEFDLNQDRTFLNNGTMGPSPRVVVEAVTNRTIEINRNGTYGGGDRECVDAIARLVNANTDEIALTHNVTEGINLAAWGSPLRKGDEVILSTHEHVGNAGPWLNLARLKGVVVKAMPYGNTAAETFEILKKRVTKKTKVIAIPHIPCTIGQIAPIKEICAWARKKNICTIVDGAHGTGMLKLDLHDMGCDVYASCCHKWLLGPKGTGYVYVRKEHQEELESIYTGGYSSSTWRITETESYLEGLVQNAHKYYYGTQSSALYFGVVEAVKFQESIGSDIIEKRVRELNQYLYQELDAMDNIDILTPKEPISRAAVVSFRFKRFGNRDFFNYCSSKKITVRYVAESDLDCVRISTHIYNDENDIETLMKEVRSKA
jgi:cysteine desulfurase / selenocysteine lyase